MQQLELTTNMRTRNTGADELIATFDALLMGVSEGTSDEYPVRLAWE